MVLSGIALVSFASSCGSRTGLWFADPCAEEGEERPCEGVCGEGIQVCEQGFFGECQVPKTASRTCRNECGEGTQTCSDEHWSDCQVPELSRVCNNDCGTGSQLCSDGAWGACEVPEREEACTGTCGTGSRVCAGGKWGECVVMPMEMPCSNLCGDGIQRCVDGIFGVCEVEISQRECRSVCGPGFESCIDGLWQACDAPLPKPPKLSAVIRDFKIEHPDFELNLPPGSIPSVDSGIVEELLGPDDKPVYASIGTTPTTTGAMNFAQWYNSLPGVNMEAALALELTASPVNPGFFVYANANFFPIDGELFGNEGNTHNFHFTLEAKTTFQYLGGEVFSFTGDDDMWVFVNRRLAIDLGGLHRPRSSSVSLDTIAGSHGLTLGETYPLHFFFAERHTYESNFTIETSIAEPGSCE